MTPLQLLRAVRHANVLRWGRTPDPLCREPVVKDESNDDAQLQVIQHMRHLIQSAELLRSAVLAKDKQKASDAIATLLSRFIITFSHDDDFMREVLHSLAHLRKLVMTDKFHDAEALILAWLVRLRQTTVTLARALRG
jgi:hypothetical protein